MCAMLLDSAVYACGIKRIPRQIFWISYVYVIDLFPIVKSLR